MASETARAVDDQWDGFWIGLTTNGGGAHLPEAHFWQCFRKPKPRLACGNADETRRYVHGDLAHKLPFCEKCLRIARRHHCNVTLAPYLGQPVESVADHQRRTRGEPATRPTDGHEGRPEHG